MVWSCLIWILLDLRFCCNLFGSRSDLFVLTSVTRPKSSLVLCVLSKSLSILLFATPLFCYSCTVPMLKEAPFWISLSHSLSPHLISGDGQHGGEGEAPFWISLSHSLISPFWFRRWPAWREGRSAIWIYFSIFISPFWFQAMASMGRREKRHFESLFLTLFISPHLISGDGQHGGGGGEAPYWISHSHYL